MRVLLFLALLPSCGDFTDFQRWEGDETCLRVTDKRLRSALERAMDDWGPLPITVSVTESKDCHNELEWVDLHTSGTTPNCYNIWGRPQHRSIHVDTEEPDCRVDRTVSHELGHFMGLGHSPSGLMSPTFDGCQEPKVSRVDRRRLMELYSE